ncbi:craniofacial development protein 2-like [Anneissia japonica]|uniref:craniofacial development protein 2-like n=1 Tax=Anneissia japonica TaxID=1529436 RepID=UPI0014255BCB|nr:craniofacial development protein 2-like [Anneissia japonica]
MSKRLIIIRMRATPFNITIIQAYAPTSDYNNEMVDDFYNQLQEVIDQIPKKDIIIVQGTGMPNYNDLILTNTFGKHKASRRWTWHHPNGQSHSQIDYIMIKRRFRSSVNIAKTRTFPGADVGSDHDLVLMTFRLHLKKASKPGQVRIKFDLDKLKDPEVAKAFQADR